MKFYRTLLSFAFVSLVFVSGTNAQEPGVATNNAQPWFKLSEDSEKPVIVYNIVQHMLVQPDPEPLLRIYGNGRVAVHFPVYMKRAGDYELQLSRQELIALLRSLAQDGILDFDHRASRDHKKQLETEQRTSTGMMHHISDSAETIIDIQLDEYQRAPGTPRIVNLKKRFAWKNLEHDAKRFPQSTAIQRAAAGAQRLHSLLERPDPRKAP